MFRQENTHPTASVLNDGQITVLIYINVNCSSLEKILTVLTKDRFRFESFTFFPKHFLTDLCDLYYPSWFFIQCMSFLLLTTTGYNCINSIKLI